MPPPRKTRKTIAGLINSNIGLVKTIARDFNQAGIDPDDIVQEGLIALWDAARYHDPARGEFKRYAGVCIRGRIRKWMGKRTTRPLHQGEEEMFEKIPNRS